MPAYRLHLECSAGFTSASRQSFPNDEAALGQARRALGQLLLDELTAGKLSPSLFVSVWRADGTAVATIRASAETYFDETAATT